MPHVVTDANRNDREDQSIEIRIELLTGHIHKTTELCCEYSFDFAFETLTMQILALVANFHARITDPETKMAHRETRTSRVYFFFKSTISMFATSN